VLVTEFSEMPPVERAKRYRQFAADARGEAANATGPAKKSYVIIAEHWDKLAADLEASINPKTGH
jgi:hypothetical protein